MDQAQLILKAIDGVRNEMSARFDDVDRQGAVVTRTLEAHDVRIRETENTLLRYRTLGKALVAVASFLGIDVLKHHFGPWK